MNGLLLDVVELIGLMCVVCRWRKARPGLPSVLPNRARLLNSASSPTFNRVPLPVLASEDFGSFEIVRHVIVVLLVSAALSDAGAAFVDVARRFGTFPRQVLRKAVTVCQ